jgi:hypothetical protein
MVNDAPPASPPRVKFSDTTTARHFFVLPVEASMVFRKTLRATSRQLPKLKVAAVLLPERVLLASRLACFAKMGSATSEPLIH